MYEIRITLTDQWTYEIYTVQSNGGRLLTKQSQVKFESAHLAFRSAMFIIDCFKHIENSDAYRRSHTSHNQDEQA